MRMGLYRINVSSATVAGKPPAPGADDYAAWNPTGTWYHCPWSYGYVVFVK
jgi:hypothetical protein